MLLPWAFSPERHPSDHGQSSDLGKRTSAACRTMFQSRSEQLRPSVSSGAQEQRGTLASEFPREKKLHGTSISNSSERASLFTSLYISGVIRHHVLVYCPRQSTGKVSMLSPTSMSVSIVCSC